MLGYSSSNCYEISVIDYPKFQDNPKSSLFSFLANGFFENINKFYYKNVFEDPQENFEKNELQWKYINTKYDQKAFDLLYKKKGIIERISEVSNPDIAESHDLPSNLGHIDSEKFSQTGEVFTIEHSNKEMVRRSLI